MQGERKIRDVRGREGGGVRKGGEANGYEI